MKIFWLILTLFSTSAFGGFLEESDVAIGTIMKSHHFKAYDYNENHNGFYIRVNQWSVGRLMNSVNNDSTVITHNRKWYQKESFVVRSVLGMATGYNGQENAIGDIMPMLGVSLQYGYFKGVLVPDALVFGVELPLN